MNKPNWCRAPKDFKELIWDTETWGIPKPSRVRLEYIGSFDARGKVRVFGRGDGWGKRASFNMDIWCSRNDELWVRFWSRSEDVEDESLKVYGMRRSVLDERQKQGDGSWIPVSLRSAYADWIFNET